MMSSTKSKKKSKSAMIPKPMKIKKEDDHIIYPMEHYIDDRVELIRQIFASLKPKTITNLAPEFLKEKKLEDIQEQCLNEILGISRKRLISIINSTKCPTDTETSEEEVHSVDEHISLEEISSDSDIAEQGKQLKGKRKLKVKGAVDNGNNKQFSVLELLELQARARAIRSQLALEPVTKIEVDTDSDKEEAGTTKKPLSSRKKPTKATTNGRPSSGKSDATKRPATATITTSKPNGEPAPCAHTKRIKLKRNFRKKTHETDDEAKNTEKATKPVEKPVEKVVEPKKEARSPSPDVIPIIAVPETLCISDSDENDEKKDTDRSQPAENSKQVQILSVVNIEAPKQLADRTESTDPATDDLPKQAHPAETEEGEILEEDDRMKAGLPGKTEAVKDTSNETHEEELTKESEEATTEKEEEEQMKEQAPDASDKRTQSADSSESEDDSNDDVISLEGGDLLNEMKEHMDEDAEELIVTTPAEEIICLDDSSEEEAKPKKGSESWNQRWLQSSKVSKVLATSRLGNRVRNKIKESKKAKKLQQEAVIEAEQTKPQEVIFTSKHADGSVDQYKELLENVQK